MEADGLLRRVLAHSIVAGEYRRPSYSLWLAPDGNDRRRRLHLLYHHGELVGRSRHAGHLITRLVTHLAAHVGLDHLVPLRMAALVTDSGAVLVPEGCRSGLAERESRLHRHGVRLVDAPLAAVDPESGELVVADAASFGDLAALGGIDGQDGIATPLSRAGRYPVVAWGFPAGEVASPLSPLEAVIMAMERVDRRGALGTRRALVALTRISEEARAFPLGGSREPVASVVQVLESLPAPQRARPVRGG